MVMDAEALALRCRIVHLCCLHDAHLGVDVRCELARAVNAGASSEFDLLVKVEGQCGYAPRLRRWMRTLQK